MAVSRRMRQRASVSPGARVSMPFSTRRSTMPLTVEGFTGQMLLQLLLGHGAGLAVQIRQGPALDGRDAIAPQLFVQAQIAR